MAQNVEWVRIGTQKNQYVIVPAKGHPKASTGGGTCIQAHVLIAEKALGRYLPDKAEIHHVNGLKYDNRPENLVICQDRAYHFFLHVRTAAYYATGNVNARKCVLCGKWDTAENPDFAIRRLTDKTSQARHRSCHATDMRKRNAQRGVRDNGVSSNV